jgi:hypothetical protein
MAIFYIDYLTGDNANDGTTWATAWKSLNGIIASRIAPGDEFRYAKSPEPTSMGQNATWLAPIVASPETEISPTSSTNTTPIQIRKNTGHGLSTGDFVQIYGHTVNTNANGLWKITKIDDEYFSLDGSVGNGAGTTSGKFRRCNNKVIELTSKVTEDLCRCNYETWTPGTNVTSSAIYTSDWKCGAGSLRIVTAAGCAANQIIAKYALPVSLDLSGYEQVSFWIKSSVALAAGALEIRLYSDTACTTLVDTLSMEAIPITNAWYQIAINKGSALSSTVQGIAVYTTIAQASKTFYFDNIIACKSATAADGLTLVSLVAKNVVNKYGDHVFTGLQSIQGVYLVLDNDITNLPSFGQGYYGVAETTTIYKREPIQYYVPTTSTFGEQISENGTVAAHYVISGGWNTVTTIKDGITIYDFRNNGYALSLYGRSYVDIHGFQIVRANTGLRGFATDGIIYDMYFSNCNMAVDINVNYTPESLKNIIALYNITGVNVLSGSTSEQRLFENVIANSNKGNGVIVSSVWNVKNLEVNNNNQGLKIDASFFNYESISSACFNKTYGIVHNTGNKGIIETITKCAYNGEGIHFTAALCTILNIVELSNNYTAIGYYITSNNNIDNIEKLNSNFRIFSLYNAFGCRIFKVDECLSNNGLFSQTGFALDIYVYNVQFGFITTPEYLSTNYYLQLYFINCTGLPSASLTNGGTDYNESKIVHHAFNQQTNNHQIIKNGGYILSDEAVRHTASGISWSLYVLKTWRDILTPLILSAAKIACLEGDTLLITAWVKKSHATDIGAKLQIKANRTAGLTTDIIAIATDTTDWQLLTLTLTATKTEIIELDFCGYWVANLADETVWIDDISITKV